MNKGLSQKVLKSIHHGREKFRRFKYSGHQISFLKDLPLQQQINKKALK